MSRIANRQSLVFNERETTLASHSRNSTWNEYYTNERQSRDSNRCATNAGSMRTNFCVFEEKLNRGVSQIRGFLTFFGERSRLCRGPFRGLFLVGALNRPRKSKRTNRENSRTIPEQIGKIPEKSGKSQKGQKRTKRKDRSRSGNPPV